MNGTNALLNLVAQRRGLKSDYAIAKALGRGQSLVSNYRKGRSQMDDDIAALAAELAGEPVDAVLAEFAAERAKTPAAKNAWLHLANLARREIGDAP